MLKKLRVNKTIKRWLPRWLPPGYLATTKKTGRLLSGYLATFKRGGSQQSSRAKDNRTKGLQGVWLQYYQNIL